jgi:anti-anti-sigma factor
VRTNRSGKTTAVRVLVTLLRQTSGVARVAGFDTDREAGRVQEAIGCAGQFAGVDDDLTVHEDLVLQGLLHGLPPSAQSTGPGRIMAPSGRVAGRSAVELASHPVNIHRSLEAMAGGPLINTLHGSDGGVVVEIRGEVDVASADRLRGILVDIASRLRPTTIVVDLLHVTFIDSTGIGALATGSNTAQRHGIRFTVRHPSPFVATQLRTTGLYDTLTADR